MQVKVLHSTGPYSNIELTIVEEDDVHVDILLSRAIHAENFLAKYYPIAKEEKEPEEEKAELPDDVNDSETCSKCIYCESKVWDNRTTKQNPKHPDYKCKKCGSAAWINNDGNLYWKENKK